MDAINLLSMLILENVNSLMGFSELRTKDEVDHSQILKWSLLKNGMIDFNLDRHLISLLGQVSINPMDFSDALYLITLNDQSLF